MSKFRKVINFLLFFCAILCSMLVITVNSENTVPTDGICKHGHNLDVVQEDTYQNGCLVCNLADMINKLPLGSDIKEEDCETVAQQIREIDKIKFDLTDEGYEELLILLDDNYSTDISRYFDAIAALQDLMGNVNLVITKKFVLEDGAVLDSNDEILKDVSISVEVTPMTGFISTSNQMMLLDNTQTFALSYDSSENSLVGKYGLSAYGRYKIREVNTNQPIVINGETYYTKSVSYTYNGNTVMSDDGVEVSSVGDDSGNVYVELQNNFGPGLDSEENDFTIKIQAVDAEETALAGAQFEIEGTGELWESNTDAHTVEGLRTGETYTIRVYTPPGGYILPAEDITFEMLDNGNGTISVEIKSGSDVANVVDNTIEVKFEKTKVQIQAVDAEETALAGAKLQILDSGENVAEAEWTSATEAHTVEGLKIGGTYTLTVTTAPYGYIRPADYNFTINDDGKISGFSGTTSKDGIMLVEFEKTKVQIQAVDSVTSGVLPGAEFKILYHDDIQITWNAGTETYKVEGLKTEETYTLTVTTAPDGYILPDDITFSINSDGSVDVNGENITTDEEDCQILNVQFYELVDVNIGAVCIEGVGQAARGTNVKGAVLQIIDSYDNVIKKWTTTDSYETIENLNYGKYTVKVIGCPKEFNQPDNWNFTINRDGSIDYGEEKHYANGVYVVLFDKVPTQNNNQNGNNNSGNKWDIENFESKEINGIKHYFDGGRTYVKIPETLGIVWLKEESDGTSAWYGLDNSSSTFEPNSIFYVEWHSPGSSKYEDLYSQLDKNIKSQIEDDNGWIFQTGVLNQAGDKITEIKNLPVNLYVQIGDDWDLKDLKSVYIQSQSDENTAVTYVENLKYPEGTDNFGIMKLKHFSPYFIYDTEDDIITDEDPIDNNTTENTQENIENTDKNNNSNINDSIATGDETTKTIILVSILVIIISGLIIFLSLRRKK